MVHEFMGQGAWTLLAALSVVGFFGLRMCRAMLRSQTAFDLRREAVISMTRQASFYSLSSHQQAAVFAALYASAPRPERSTPQGRFHGFQNIKTQRPPVPLRTFTN